MSLHTSFNAATGLHTDPLLSSFRVCLRTILGLSVGICAAMVRSRKYSCFWGVLSSQKYLQLKHLPYDICSRSYRSESLSQCGTVRADWIASNGSPGECLQSLPRVALGDCPNGDHCRRLPTVTHESGRRECSPLSDVNSETWAC